MAWFARMTRFGQVHMCYAQEKSDSCGIACAIMANFKLKAGSLGLADFAETLFPSYGSIIGKLLGAPPQTNAAQAEKQVYKLISSTYDGTVGTNAVQVAGLLNKLGIGTWVGEDNPASNAIAGRVMQSYKRGWPTIIGNSWYSGADHSKLAGGGHWVLVDTINKFGGKDYASICDPITGNVHVTEFKVGQDFIYDPSNPIGFEVNVDDFKAYKTGYDSKSFSKMDAMIYCTSCSSSMVGTSGPFAE